MNLLRGFPCVGLLLLAAATCLPGSAPGIGLTIAATGDDFLYVSTGDGAYVTGPNWSNWHHSDLFRYDIQPGQEAQLLFHILSPVTQMRPELNT